MHSLLVIAHGSRLEISNNEVKDLVNSLKPQLESQFDKIQAAFLELCEPSIANAIDDLVLAGFTEITVMPYFLNQGRHVSEDVPHELDVKQSQYPNLSINLLPYFGSSNEITNMLSRIIRQS